MAGFNKELENNRKQDRDNAIMNAIIIFSYKLSLGDKEKKIVNEKEKRIIEELGLNALYSYSMRLFNELRMGDQNEEESIIQKEVNDLEKAIKKGSNPSNPYIIISREGIYPDYYRTIIGNSSIYNKLTKECQEIHKKKFNDGLLRVLNAFPGELPLSKEAIIEISKEENRIGYPLLVRYILPFAAGEFIKEKDPGIEVIILEENNGVINYKGLNQTSHMNEFFKNEKLRKLAEQFKYEM